MELAFEQHRHGMSPLPESKNYRTWALASPLTWTDMGRHREEGHMISERSEVFQEKAPR